MNQNESTLYEKVISQMLYLNIDYKNINDLANFKLNIRNIVTPLFRGYYDVSRGADYIYIGQVLKEQRQYEPDICVPHGIGMKIKYDRTYRIGKWNHGISYGYIISKNSDGSQYKGEFGQTNNKADGYGMYVLPGKIMYEGNWKNGKKHGEGVIIVFIDGTKMVNFVAKGYFDMNKPVGIHLQTIVEDNKTYIINYDYNTKEVLSNFITPADFKKSDLRKYQPNPPLLSTDRNVNPQSRADIIGQEAKAARIRATKAKEASMTPEERKIAKIKAKAEAIAALKAKTIASRDKDKPSKNISGKEKEKVAPKPIVHYAVNPEDIDSDVDSDVEIINDLTDDEDDKLVKKCKKLQINDDDDDKPDNTCVICMENEIDSVILECGHMAICYSCSIIPSFKRKCPICRRPIQRVKQIYKAR